MIETTEIRAITDALRSSGRWSRATPIISAVSPSPTPWAALPTSSHANGSGSTVSTLPATTTASVARIVARRCGPAPSRPRTGVATAPLSSATVSVHCALPSETWNEVATLVMSGVPRLATAATTRAMNIRAGTSSRASERAPGNAFTATPPTGCPVTASALRGPGFRALPDASAPEGPPPAPRPRHRRHRHPLRPGAAPIPPGGTSRSRVRTVTSPGSSAGPSRISPDRCSPNPGLPVTCSPERAHRGS